MKEDKNFIKFKVLYDIIHNLKDQWDNGGDYERSHIETIVGAAIFYLPTNIKTFTGLISEEALLVNKTERVKEHQYPRKVSANILMKNPPSSIEDLISQYENKYGTWNYVTKKENSTLRKYQTLEKFTNPEDSYKLANIILKNI
jgi:hypothetical protein